MGHPPKSARADRVRTTYEVCRTPIASHLEMKYPVRGLPVHFDVKAIACLKVSYCMLNSGTFHGYIREVHTTFTRIVANLDNNEVNLC